MGADHEQTNTDCTSEHTLTIRALSDVLASALTR